MCASRQGWARCVAVAAVVAHQVDDTRRRAGEMRALAQRAAGDRQRDPALLRAARARPVDRGEMGETAHFSRLAHLCRLAQSPIASHMPPMLIETESTPNPATLKFLPGRTVMDSGTRDFATPEEAELSPLADALFRLGDVTGVFFGTDFVTVTKTLDADWQMLRPQVLGAIMEHYLAGMPILEGAAAEEHAEDFEPADQEIVLQIKELLDTRVRPAVAGDGGNPGVLPGVQLPG